MLEVKTQRKRKIKLGDEEEFKVNTFLLVIEGKKIASVMRALNSRTPPF